MLSCHQPWGGTPALLKVLEGNNAILTQVSRVIINGFGSPTVLVSCRGQPIQIREESDGTGKA